MKTIMQRLPENMRPFMSVSVNAYGFGSLETRVCLWSTRNPEEVVKALLTAAKVEGVDTSKLFNETMASGRQYTYDANGLLVDLELMYHKGIGTGIRVDSDFLLPK